MRPRGNPMKMLRASRMIRQSVGGLATRSCAPQNLERDRTQNRYPLLLITLRAERQAEGYNNEY